MSAAEITRSLQQFLASVAAIERSRFAMALLADPIRYATVFHQQIGDPRQSIAVPDADAETMQRILDLATDRSDAVSLTDVGSALRSAAAAKAIPERLPGDWRDARARITEYLALAGPLPSAPDATAAEAPAAFRTPREVTREELVRVIMDGGIRPTDDEQTRTFTAWRGAPPFFTVVEQVFVSSLADLARTLSAMRQYIVQPAVVALASAAAPAAKPFETA